MTDHKNSIEQRLNKHPHLKKRIEKLLEVVENTDGDFQKANDAEQRVIEELRKMGNEVLHDWASNREKQEFERILNNKKGLIGNGKKNNLAYHLLLQRHFFIDF